MSNYFVIILLLILKDYFVKKYHIFYSYMMS